MYNGLDIFENGIEPDYISAVIQPQNLQPLSSKKPQDILLLLP